MEMISRFLAMCGDGLVAAASMPLGLPAALFLAALAGSLVHCVGMCGPFVLGQVMAAVERPSGRPYGEWHRLTGALLVPYICRHGGCRSRGGDRSPTPPAMPAWSQPWASGWRPTTPLRQPPATIARPVSFCAPWRWRASRRPTSCCSPLPSGRAMTARWAMPHAPCSTGCRRPSPCRPSPMPAGPSFGRPWPHSGPGAPTWTCRYRSASRSPASSACGRPHSVR